MLLPRGQGHTTETGGHNWGCSASAAGECAHLLLGSTWARLPSFPLISLVSTGLLYSSPASGCFSTNHTLSSPRWCLLVSLFHLHWITSCGSMVLDSCKIPRTDPTPDGLLGFGLSIAGPNTATTLQQPCACRLDSTSAAASCGG